MAEVEYMHICDYAFSGEGGKACVIGIFDQLHASDFPTKHPQLWVAVQLQGTPNEVIRGVRIEVRRPNGDVIAALDPPPLTAGSSGRTNLNVAMQGLVFPEQGRYTFKVTLAGRVLSTTSLQVRRIQQGATPPATTH